jgi:hypothetical protein
MISFARNGSNISVNDGEYVAKYICWKMTHDWEFFYLYPELGWNPLQTFNVRGEPDQLITMNGWSFEPKMLNYESKK